MAFYFTFFCLPKKISALFQLPLFCLWPLLLTNITPRWFRNFKRKKRNIYCIHFRCKPFQFPEIPDYFCLVFVNYFDFSIFYSRKWLPLNLTSFIDKTWQQFWAKSAKNGKKRLNLDYFVTNQMRCNAITLPWYTVKILLCFHKQDGYIFLLFFFDDMLN